MKHELLNLGWGNDKVFVTGIPCPVDMINDLCEFKTPFLLIAGGGWGLGNLEKTTEQLLNAQLHFNLVVVSGKNSLLYRRLKKLECKNTGKLTVEATLPNLYSLMKNGYGVITKPGGLTVTEAMILKKPLILLKPLPGAEEHNYEFLLEHGAAITFETFLKNPAIIMNWEKSYSEHQALVAQTNSSRMIAECILTR